MNKFMALCLTALLCLCCLASCNNTSEPKEITCEDIIRAYEDAGYFVTHSAHQDEGESSQLCYIKANATEASNSDYIYFTVCFTEQQAKDVRETDKYNLFIWFYATVSGESRWLKTGTYGNIAYSYYNSEFIKPFQELIR